MSTFTSHRKTISILTGLSGIFILFRHAGHGIRPPYSFSLLKHIHEYGGILFILIAVIHICINGKTFIKYFRKS